MPSTGCSMGAAMGLLGEKKNDDQERIGVKGMPVNPKLLGGPSTTALSPDDPGKFPP